MPNKFSAFLATAAIATGTVATLAVAPAHAATCSVNDVTYNLNNLAVAATNCIKGTGNDVQGGGNPLLSQLNTLFGVNYDWQFVGKDEQAGLNTPANGFDGFSATKSGTWSVTPPIKGPFAISVKAADEYAVYFFDKITSDMSIFSGAWSTDALRTPNGKNQPNLSHISLFTAKITVTPPTPKHVPEPASLLGLGLVASGMVVARRRRTLAN